MPGSIPRFPLHLRSLIQKRRSFSTDLSDESQHFLIDQLCAIKLDHVRTVIRNNHTTSRGKLREPLLHLTPTIPPGLRFPSMRSITRKDQNWKIAIETPSYRFVTGSFKTVAFRLQCADLRMAQTSSCQLPSGQIQAGPGPGTVSDQRGRIGSAGHSHTNLFDQQWWRLDLAQSHCGVSASTKIRPATSFGWCAA